MVKKLFLTFILLTFVSFNVQADISTSKEKADKIISLQELIDYALKNNPYIKAARLKWEKTISRYPQAISLSDPVLILSQPIESIETRLGPQARILSLSQKFPFPGELRLKGEIVKKDIEIALIEYKDILRDTVTEIKKTYYELYYIDKAIKLAEEDKTVLNYFFEVSKTNYSLDVSELDELVRAEKLAAHSTEKLIVLQEERKRIEAHLNALLNRSPDYPVGHPEELSFQPFRYPIKDLYKKALNNYEKIRIAGLRVEKSVLNKELSFYTYYPRFQVGLNYVEIRKGPLATEDNGRDAFSVALGLSIPIWSSRNKAVVQEAEVGIQKSKRDKEAIVNTIEKEIKALYHTVSRAAKIINLYKDTLIPEAKESVDFAEARYKTGKEHLGRLLETQSMWIQFRLTYYRALVDYLKGVADLERLTGQDLSGGKNIYNEGREHEK